MSHDYTHIMDLAKEVEPPEDAFSPARCSTTTM